MKKKAIIWIPWRRVKWLLAVQLVAGSIAGQAFIHASGAEPATPAWANPSDMAVRKVSEVGSAQSEPNFLSNLDCTLMTYRLVASSSMQTGCFTATAFGLVDTDSDTVIFNGTDEGLPLLPYSAHQVLVPWPQALDLVGLDATNNGGSYISLYKNPLGLLRDQRNVLGELTSKQLTAPPELTLKDSSGQPLVINPQTMAFSDNGSWLVAESLHGSFVRINLATLDVTNFGQAYATAGSPGVLKSQVAVSSDGRYVAINNETAGEFKVYDVASCGAASGEGIMGCRSYDYRQFVKGQVGGLQSIRHVRFINDGLLSFEAVSGDTAKSGIYELAPVSSITSLMDYIGLGDSYTAGEGAFDYLAGTDTAANSCHLSRNSYPLLLTHDLYSGAGGHSVACSGAVISDVGNTSDNYLGQMKDGLSLRELKQAQPALLNSVMANFLPGYVAQHAFVKQYQPQVTTVSVGGDDIGFGDLLQNCVEPHISWHVSDSTCYDTYEARLEVMQLIDRTIPRWTALYKQLLAESPGTQLYAVGYPQIIDDRGDCALNVHLNKSELEFSEELIDYLNQAISKAAAKAGVSYTDISQALAGHRLCETASYNVAVNGLTAGKDAGLLGINVLGKESYHPNALGQQLIEQTILRQTNNLTKALAATGNNNASAGQSLLNKPKSNRPINKLIPSSTLTNRVVKRGTSAQIRVDGLANGLKANSPYSVRLDGPAGPVLAVVVSDGNGTVSGSVTVPVSAEPGGHTIDVTGPNQIGDPVDVTQPVHVPGDVNDDDGDGVPDATDSCPTVANSGQDVDQDGIDDACDNLIGQPPGSSGPGSNGSGGSINTTNGNGANGSPQPPTTSTGGSSPNQQVGGAQGTPARGTGPANTGPGLPLALPSLTLASTSLSSGTTASSFSSSQSFTSRPFSTKLHATPGMPANANLGDKTVNPANVGAKGFKLPVNPTEKSGHFSKLRTINWLFWSCLLIFPLFLLILIAWSAWYLYQLGSQGGVHPYAGSR